MNTLTDPLKRIARDLVDKKLWPVAALLLAALVALPILIGGGSSGENIAAPVATAPGSTGAGSLITVADPSASGKDSRPGAIEDPFYDPPAPPDPESASAAGPAPSAPASGVSGGASGGGAAPATSSPPAQTTGPPPTSSRPQPSTSVAESVYYRTAARWYAADSGKPRPLTRLTPLGGRAAPAALYLGVTRSKSTYAVFLLAPEATSEGDAECEESDCRVIGLKAGQSQIVTMPSPDGGTARRYHLEVVSVKAVATDVTAARAMRARVHRDGRDVMRAMWQHRPTAEALQPIQYDQDSGLLFKKPVTKASR